MPASFTPLNLSLKERALQERRERSVADIFKNSFTKHLQRLDLVVILKTKLNYYFSIIWLKTPTLPSTKRGQADFSTRIVDVREVIFDTYILVDNFRTNYIYDSAFPYSITIERNGGEKDH